MFNFNINFTRIIKDNIPYFLRFPIRLNRIKAMILPFKVIYNGFILALNDLIYKAKFNGTVIYLETALNDRFDPVNRAIFISEFDFAKIYIYKKSELRPPLILYMKWKPTINYLVGQFAWVAGSVYQANAVNINKIPGVDPQWTLTPRVAPVLRMASNFNGLISFVVNVPSTLVFNLAEMNATIKYWKLAGPGYIIITF